MTVAMDRKPTVFMSHARADDVDGRLTWVHAQLERRLVRRTGRRDLRIFRDTRNIPVGVSWRGEIEHALRAADVLLVFVTPSLLDSDVARREVSAFVERERARPRLERIVLVRYVGTEMMRAAERRRGEEILRLLAEREHVDWRPVAEAPPDAPQLRQKLDELADHVALRLLAISEAEAAGERERTRLLPQRRRRRRSSAIAVGAAAVIAVLGVLGAVALLASRHPTPATTAAPPPAPTTVAAASAPSAPSAPSSVPGSPAPSSAPDGRRELDAALARVTAAGMQVRSVRDSEQGTACPVLPAGGVLDRYVAAHRPCVAVDRAMVEVTGSPAGPVEVAVSWVQAPDAAAAEGLDACLQRGGTGRLAELVPFTRAELARSRWSSHRDGAVLVGAEGVARVASASGDAVQSVVDSVTGGTAGDPHAPCRP